MFDKFKIVLQPPTNQRLAHLQEALSAVGDELCRGGFSTNWSHRDRAQSSFLSHVKHKAVWNEIYASDSLLIFPKDLLRCSQTLIW